MYGITIKNFLIISATFLFLLPITPLALAANIGIVFDGPSNLNKSTLHAYKKEIIDLTEGEFDITFPEKSILVSDWTASGVRASIDTLLTDPNVDIVITLGIIGSTEISRRKNLPKPVIAPWIIDTNLLGIPSTQDGTSGITNLYFLDTPATLDRDIRVFKEIVEFQKLALLYMPIVTDLVPEIEGYVINVARENDIEILLLPERDTVEGTISAIPPDIQAVLVTPLINYTNEEIAKLYDGLIERDLPSFSMIGMREVEQGALIGLTPVLDITRQARRVALAVQSILLGEDAGNLPVEFKEQEKLTINMSTARALNFYPSWRVMTDADLINEKSEASGRTLTLQQAVDESVKANLDILAADQFVAAGAQNVKLALSELLPQSDIFLENNYIDKDRAAASFGTQPERSISGVANLRQLIYSDSAWSNLTVQKRLQDSRKYSRDEIRLDIIAATSIGYLNVIRAKTIENIQIDNLKLSKSNLEIAEVRRDIGVASPAEVYRWESEISSDRIEVVNAEAQRKNTEILLNRLLHRPQGEKFSTVETGLDDPTLIVSDPRLDRYINNPGVFEIFLNFMVSQGLEQSPEISNLDSQIQAQDRILKTSKRAFWLPTLSAFGEVRQFFYEGGAGSDVELGEDFPIDIAEQDDTEWLVQFQASFPLFRSGGKMADYRQARSELSRLRFEKDSTRTKVEEEIRTSLNNSGASFPSIRFANDAAEAARKNLELVTDSYSRGVVSIIDLLDAQNAALSAELNAANAVYDFLIDLMNVQRAVGNFDFFTTPEERMEWFRELEEFYLETKSMKESPESE